MPRHLDYRADLQEDLRNNHVFAAEYLSAAYADSREAFLVALRDIVEAKQGIAQVATEAAINRENLYRILSEEGNPRLSSLRPVLGTLGFGVQFTALGSIAANEPKPIAIGTGELKHESTTGTCVSTTMTAAWGGHTLTISGDPSVRSPYFGIDDVPMFLVATTETSKDFEQYKVR